MHQLAGLARGWNGVIPAPRYMRALRQSENGVSDGIAMVMIVEKPGVERLLAESGLNRVDLHARLLLEPQVYPKAVDMTRQPGSKSALVRRADVIDSTSRSTP